MTLKSFLLIAEALAECCVSLSLRQSSFRWATDDGISGSSSFRSDCQRSAAPIGLLGIVIGKIVYLTLQRSEPAASTADVVDAANRIASSLLHSAIDRYGIGL